MDIVFLYVFIYVRCISNGSIAWVFRGARMKQESEIKARILGLLFNELVEDDPIIKKRLKAERDTLEWVIQ